MIKQIQRNLLYLISNLLSYSHNQPEPVDTIVCSKADVQFYADTPNTIIYYDVDSKKGYFRECKKHLAPRAFTKQLIDEYCSYIFDNEKSAEFKEILEEKIEKAENFKKFFNMGAGTVSYTRINKFRHSGNASWIGINEPYPDWFATQLPSLVQYAWGALDEYKYCKRYKIDNYHTYNSNRTITTKKIADLLGADEIIPSSMYIKMILDGQERIGVSVGVAPGVTPAKGLAQCVSPELQREHLILNVLDVICYQKDHRPGNYFVTINNGVVERLSAFDNDCPTTLFVSPQVKFKTYAGCAPLVDERGYIKRPYLDKMTTLKLLEIKKNDVRALISDSSSNFEIEFIWKRITKLKRAIKRSLDENRLRLLDIKEWSYDTINEELSGRYGETYLKLFCDLYI